MKASTTALFIRSAKRSIKHLERAILALEATLKNQDLPQASTPPHKEHKTRREKLKTYECMIYERAKLGTNNHITTIKILAINQIVVRKKLRSYLKRAQPAGKIYFARVMTRSGKVGLHIATPGRYDNKNRQRMK